MLIAPALWQKHLLNDCVFTSQLDTRLRGYCDVVQEQDADRARLEGEHALELHALRQRLDLAEARPTPLLTCLPTMQSCFASSMHCTLPSSPGAKDACNARHLRGTQM